VVLATGLGKTLTSAFIGKEFRAKRILFLVHNNFILDHAMSEFKMVFDEKRVKMLKFNGMSRKGVKEADILFATWQTMGRNLKRWKRNHFDLIIVDEAHHSEADTYRPTLKYFTGPRLGITATPDREDEADIRDVFGPEVIDITLEEAIARGWLPRIEYHVITDESLDEDALQEIAREIREEKRRFTMAEVNRRIFIKKRDVEIARIINGYDEKAIVFCTSIPHANSLQRSLKLSTTFHSKKGENEKETWEMNQQVLDHLKNGIVRRVCAVNAFNEGVNVPSVGLVAFCRVTGVLTVFRQQLGRGLRPGKDKIIVLDFVGNLERIQLVLEMMNKVSDLHEQFTPRGEMEREGYARQRFEVSGKGFEFTFSDEVVDLMEILQNCERDFYPTWQEAGEATKKLGIRSQDQYRQRYKKDPRLPSAPDATYKDFPGFTIFLEIFYLTVSEAATAAQALGIKSAGEYKKKYKKDPKLNSAPDRHYKDFPGWPKFLNLKKGWYETCEDAAQAARALSIPNRRSYMRMRLADKKLHATPQKYYPDFPGWKKFLETSFYITWQEAAVVARKLKANSKTYEKLREQDKKLPSTPHRTYADWPGWPKFLGKE